MKEELRKFYEYLIAEGMLKGSLDDESFEQWVYDNYIRDTNVSGSVSDWKKPLIDRVKYELRKYTELAKRMDELLDECNLEAKYDKAREAEIKRNCYNKIVNDLKLLTS